MAFNVPMQYFGAAPITNPDITGAVTVPMALVSGAAISVNSGIIQVPKQLLDGALLVPVGIAGNITVPVQQLVATVALTNPLVIDIASTLPGISSVIVAATIIDIESEIYQAINSDIEVLTGAVATISSELPQPLGSAFAGHPNEIVSQFPYATSDIAAIVGSAAEIDSVLPSIESSITASASIVCGIVSVLPHISSGAECLAGLFARIDAKAPGISGQISSNTGVSASIDSLLAQFGSAGSFAYGVTGGMASRLPVIRADIYTKGA